MEVHRAISSSRTIQLRIVVVICILNALGWMWTNVRVLNLATSFKREIRQSDSPDDRPRSVPSRSETQARDEIGFVDVGRDAGLEVPGISNPMMRRAEDVQLEDRANVIGVEFNGQARAYVVSAMEVHSVQKPEDLSVHVVSDMIGDQPVCVTHCNLTNSTRVFTNTPAATDSAEPIDLRIGGWDRGLMLLFDGTRYHQYDSAFPLEDQEFMTTTWQQWYAAHPDTLVYTGGDRGR